MKERSSPWGLIRGHLLRHRYFYLFAAVFLVFYVIPLLFIQLPNAHDKFFHMTRISCIAEELQAGHFPVRLYSSVYNNYGYACPLFYGDWLLYLPGLLVALGMQLETAFRLMLLFCAAGASVSCYFCAKSILKEQSSAFIVTLLYGLSPYLFDDIFARMALGEVQAFLFLPILFLGLYDIVLRDGRLWYLLGIGMCGLLVTHLLTAAASVVVCVLFCLIFIRRLFRQPKKFLWIGAAALLFFALSASFLFPMMEQLASSSFLGTDGTSASILGGVAERAFPSLTWAFSPVNVLVYSYTPNGTFYPNGVGFAVVVMLAYRLRYRRQLHSPVCDAHLILGLVLLFCTTRYFCWTLLEPIVGALQFPWRLLIFVTLLLSLAGGMLMKQLGKIGRQRLFLRLIIGAAVLSLCCAFVAKYKPILRGNEPQRTFRQEIGTGEYLPSPYDAPTLTQYKHQLMHRGDVTSSNHEFTESSLSRANGSVTFAFSGNQSDDTYVDLPLIYYQGYSAVLSTPDGKTSLPTGRGYNNVVRVSLGDAESGSVTVCYTGTMVQHCSFAVSILSILLLTVSLVLLHLRKRKQASLPPAS